METFTAAFDGGDAFDDTNIGTSILMCFTDPNLELHFEIRKLIILLSHQFRGLDTTTPPTPVDYLCALCSSLSDSSSKQEQVLEAHLTIMSILIPKVTPAILINKFQLVLDTLSKLLRPLTLRSQRFESTLAFGVKCIALLIIAITSCVHNWSDISEAFDWLMSFAALQHKMRVRLQLRVSLPAVLQSFQGTVLCDPASKMILDLLNNCPPTPYYDANSCKSVLPQKQKSMHALDVVVVTLCFMSTEDRTAVLNTFKTFLELHQNYLTVRIIDALYSLSLNPSPDVPPELYLDLICSVCFVVTQKKTNHIPDMTSGLLSNGMAKVYSYNPQICKTKLPIVFDALRVVLEKSIQSCKGRDYYNAMQAFKCLIHACIDESLIKEGVDRVVTYMDDGNRSEQTTIEILCSTIQSLLGYGDTTLNLLEVVSTMFEKLGEYSSHLMRGTLKILADMLKMPDQEFIFKEQVKLLLKTIVEKCGIEAIMAVLPQEDMKMLVAVIKEMVSKSLEAESLVLKANTVKCQLPQSGSPNNQARDKSDVRCNNLKRKILTHEVLVRHRAKRAAKKRMSATAAVTEMLKL